MFVAALQLTAVFASDDPLRDDWVDHFPTSLVVLNLAYCAVLSDRYAPQQRYPCRQCVTGAHAARRILQKFKRLPRLRDLDVEGCFQLTDAGMATLGERSLCVVWCAYVRGDGVRLTRCKGPNVESLNMAQCIGVFRKGEARRGVLPGKYCRRVWCRSHPRIHTRTARLQKLRLSFNFNDHFILYIPDTLTCLYLEKSYVTDGGMRVSRIGSIVGHPL